MGAFNSPHRFDRDTFHLLQVGKIEKSTMLKGGLKNSYKLAKQSREIQFGFNRKQDNQHKTKQLKLF